MNADQIIKNFERAQSVIALAYDPDQPRDENGRFGSGGGGKDDKESGGKGDLQNTKNLSSSDLMKAVPELPHAAAEYIKIVNANAGGKDVIHLPRTGQIPHAAMKKLREIYAGRKVETFDLRASQPGGRFQTKSERAMTDVMFGKKLSFADNVIKNFERAQLPIKLAFDPDQPRDEAGRFGSNGGGSDKGGKDSGPKETPFVGQEAKVSPEAFNKHMKDSGLKISGDKGSNTVIVKGDINTVSDSLVKAGWAKGQMSIPKFGAGHEIPFSKKGMSILVSYVPGVKGTYVSNKNR